MLTQERIEELAEMLESGAMDVYDFLEEDEYLSPDDEYALYSIVDTCHACGWYYYVADMNTNDYGEYVCWRCEDEEE